MLPADGMHPNRSRVGACPPPRNVAALEPAIIDITQVGNVVGRGLGGDPPNRCAPPRPVDGYDETEQADILTDGHAHAKVPLSRIASPLR
jgi:hypothetical protein